MSTIVTRKSLALGAIVALATTVFAGTPAHAAGEINLVATAGTSYSTLATDAFALESSFAPGVINSNSQLWFQIKTSTNVSVDVTTDTADTTGTSVFASGDRKVAVTGDASDPTAFVRYYQAKGTSATARNFLSLALHAGTSIDSADVVVTAFVDSSNDNKLTAGEWSTSKTISFKSYASVAPVISLDQPAVGDTTATGYLTLPGINLSQVQSPVALKFSKDGTTALAGGSLTPVTATKDTTAGNYKATSTAGTAYTSIDTVEVQATVKNEAVGTYVKKTATDRTISKFEASIDANDNGTAAGLVRVNSTFSSTAIVYSNASTPAAIAGIAVKATVDVSDKVWDTTAGSEQTVTLNGTKYTTYAAFSAAAAALALTSDASGKVTVTVTPANFASNDTFDVSFIAQNITKTVRATESATVYTVKDVASAPVRAIAKNSSATLQYTVKDQFGVSAAATNLRLKVTSALKTQYVPVAAGAATVVVTPTADSTDAVVAHVVLQASTVGSDQSVTWDVSPRATDAADITVNVKTVADSFTTAPALTKVNDSTYNATSNYKQTIENKAYTATDFPVAAGSTLAQIDGAAATNGADVTVSGAGLAFVVGGKVYTDTVTFPAAGGSGAFTVYVAGHKPGKATVTFVTGAVTKTVDVTFDAAVVASLKNTVVAAPTQAQAGRAVNVTATLTDAYGNAIAGKLVKFAVTGVGSLSSSDAVTDANGVATVRLVSSYGEDGDSVVTVSHNGANGVTDTAATTTPDDFTLVKTVTFGITDASIDNVNNRVTAVASYSKGKTVGFYVDGVKKWSKVSTSDADVVVNFNLKKGRHTVTVKISGGFIASEVIIVQ